MNNNYIKLERQAQRGLQYFEQPDADWSQFEEFSREVLEPRAPYMLEMLTATETTEECGRIKRIVAKFEGIITRYDDL